MKDAVTATGGCLCGGVRYRLTGVLREVINCFCEQCRKTSGHYVAASSVSLDHFALSAEQSLRWYQSSPTARRGFCHVCGSSLFWQPEAENRVSISAGTIDAPTGLKTTKNIFVEDKSDYHSVPEIHNSQ